MSMAHSLELRVPFLDAPLVEHVLALPSLLKFNPLYPKSLLLGATIDLLPEKSWNRPKMGFSLPMESWMRRPLRDFCRQGVELSGSHLALSSTKIDDLWKKWETNRLSWPKVWALVVLGHYLDSRATYD
jgi:asparagine synthase (glutamine-hydrolysing)